MTAPARWPDLFIAGAAAAGTREVARRLAAHPDVFLATPEEPHFFSAIQPAGRLAASMPVVRAEADYLRLFAGAGDARVVAEASTSYLWSPEAPARIHAVAPDARILLLLRDPIERAWSHHAAASAGGLERRGFLRVVRDETDRAGVWGQGTVYLGAGRYADGVERILRLFGPDRVAVHFWETFSVDPRGTTRDLFTWLDLDPARAVETPPSLPPTPAGPLRRWARALAGARMRPTDPPSMDPTIRRLLEHLYAPDVTRLSELLGIIPPWSVTPAF
jgi:hypothetical protein